MTWREPHHPALMTTAAGLFGLGVVGWNTGGSDETLPIKNPEMEQGEIAELFAALSQELSAAGALYAYFDEDQALKAVATTAPEGDFAPVLRLSDDPITRVLLNGKPQAFTLYQDATAIDQPTLQGRSTLAYPLFLRGGPVGLALFASRQTELGDGDIEKIGAWAPHLARAVESTVLAERLARSRRENEALLTISRLAQSPVGTTGLFADAVTQIRHLTGAQHVAIALRAPDPQPGAAGFQFEALATGSDPSIRKVFETGAWDAREWPHLLSALSMPSRAALLTIQDLPLTPAEASWLDALAPASHVLGVAFGGVSAPEGMLLLCWPDDEPLRFYETRLVLALADQLTLIAANRRLNDAQQARGAAAHATQARPVHALGSGLALAPLGATLETLIQQEMPKFRAAGLTLRADVQSDARLPLEATALSEVVGVLLDNARRCSSPGSRVRLWLAQADGWATLYVADTGCGIPSALQARIGEAGFQVDPERGGAGMGLSHARRLVETVGGTLGFTSREGTGSTFYVTLPIAASEAPRRNA